MKLKAITDKTIQQFRLQVGGTWPNPLYLADYKSVTVTHHDYFYEPTKWTQYRSHISESVYEL